ncbi:hypothetical protein TRFO_22850 [Tritrichomonas foetus]|uniref:Uncharacterized protein n=1 Tax=Tritrichomonas foetus TaxID=1144522 RepID=A0A1J4KC82_9EUKA|nr:hypothetical protein TRFO_22850 [Tritrichomonas foetus]|eukprot:OHT08586.1 hypothetical protein TRFO_22850 [Tritrichomonas foetus]
MKDIPVDFLEPLSNCDIEGIAEEDVPPLIEQIKEALNGEYSNAAALVFAPLCHGISHLNESIGTFARDTLLNILKKDDDESKLVGCYMLMFAGHLFAHEPETAPETNVVYDLMKPLLVHSNEVLRKRANKAYRTLLDTEFFLNDTSLGQYLNLFNEFPAEYYPEYFKIISSYVIPHEDDDEEDQPEEDEEADITIIQPIVDFVHDNLHSNTEIVRALCLDVMSDLGYKDRMFIEDDVNDALDVASDLIKASSVGTYIYVANFLATLAESFKDEAGTKIEELVVPIIKEINNDQIGVLKKKIDCASTVATIIKLGFAVNQSDVVAQFISANLPNATEDTITRLCNVIHPLSKSIGEENAVNVFKALVEALKVCEDSENAELITLCIEKLTKHYNIPEDILLPLVNASLEGNLKFLNGSLPHKIFPPCVPPFMIITAYIKKFPTKGAQFIPTLLDWFGHTQFSIAPVVLIPIKASFDVGCFPEDRAEEFGKMIKEMIEKCEVFDGNELGALAEAARKLFQAYASKMTPIEDFLKPFIKFAKKSLPDEEEEEEIDIMTGEGIPEVTNFVFSVYAGNDEVEVIDELLAPLLMNLPFEPGCEEVSDILSNLTTMFENTERFKDVLVPGLRMFAELLLLKKAELEAYNLDDELISDLKGMLKNCCKKDKKLVAALTKDFKSSRAKLNRFNALIR